VPDSIVLASGTNLPNPPNDDTDKSDNSDPFHCDIMPSSSDKDESASIKYLKRHPDPSLRSWDGVSFYNTERTLNNACIRGENFYRLNKKIHIHKQRSKIYKMGIFNQHNLAHLKYLQSMKNPTFDYSTDEESKYFGNEFSFSEDNEEMLMVKSLDYKLRASKASEIRSLTQKNENKKARMAILELPGVKTWFWQSYCRNRLKHIAVHGIIRAICLFSSNCVVDIFSFSPSVKIRGLSFVPFLVLLKLVSLWGSFCPFFTSSPLLQF
jgi:hypothetical protein